MQENGGFYLYDLMHCSSISHFGCAQDFTENFKGWLRNCTTLNSLVKEKFNEEVEM